MWKPIYDPGPWKAYLSKKENKGLPIMEVRKKYLKEHLLFEDFITQQQNVIKGVANKKPPFEDIPLPSLLFPSSLYSEEIYLVEGLITPRTRVREWIKYEGQNNPYSGFVTDKAYANFPVYFHSYNLEDDDKYTYNTNGVFGEWMRYDPFWGYWLTVKCSYYSYRGDPPACSNAAFTNFGIPIPDVNSPLEWGNLIGTWDVLGTTDEFWNYMVGCSIPTVIDSGEDPSYPEIGELQEWNTYTEDPGTATFGTNYCLEQGGEYVLPESWYWANDDIPCGSEPLNYLRTIINAVIRGDDGSSPQKSCNISDEGDLINGRRYWDSDPISEIGGGTNTYVIRIQWTGGNWEMVYFTNGGTEASQITTSTNNTYTFPYNEYTGRYGRFDMATNLTSVPWSSKVIVGTHVDINYGSAPPTTVCDLWSEVTIQGGPALSGQIQPTHVLDISDEGDLINGKRYWNKTQPIKGGGERIWQLQWDGSQWVFTYDDGSGSTITVAQGGTLLYPYDCQTGGDDMVMTSTGEYLSQYPEWSTESGGTNLSLTALSFERSSGSVVQKLTATSDGTTANPPNGKPIYTVNDGTSDYVVQWEGTHWEITKSTGGSNPVVITTNTDVTYEWDELPNNVVTWTMIPGENTIETGTSPGGGK